MITIDLVDALKKLKNVKQDKNGYNAQCPVHKDKHNSLSITQKGDKLLIKCQAGCDFREIIKCITDKNPFTATSEKVYRYIDNSGEIIHETVRANNKKFFQRHHNGKEYVYNLQGVNTILYNLPDVINAIETGNDIYIVEGEKDCDNLKTLGFIGTTCPMGAGKWKKEYNKYLKGAKNVIILPDNDKPGKEHAENVFHSLKCEVENIQIIYLPDLEDKEDISDFIRKNGKEYTIDFLKKISKIEKEDKENDIISSSNSNNIVGQSNCVNNIGQEQHKINKWYKIHNNKKYFMPKILAECLINDHCLCLLNNLICLRDKKTTVSEYKFKGEFIIPCLDNDVNINQIDNVYMLIIYILSGRGNDE